MALLRINRHPSRAQLLLFSLAWLAVVGWIALSVSSHGREAAAGILGIAALAIPACWLVAPRAARWAYLGLSYATYPIGFVVSHLVLAVAYFAVFAPVGWLMRKPGKRDALGRSLDRAAPTYWTPRPPAPEPAQYLRQR